jgi:hypothetical protein
MPQIVSSFMGPLQGELINLVGALGLASTRVAGLMRTQKYIGGNIDSFDDQINSLIDEITRD